jgi:hypothetical protein
VASHESGGWQLGDLDLSEYPDRYRDQRLMRIIAPIGEAEAPTYICGVCGFVMNERGECPRCKLIVQGQKAQMMSRRRLMSMTLLLLRKTRPKGSGLPGQVSVIALV